jgi:hypothetical protein
MKLSVVALAAIVACGCGGASSDGLFDGKNPANVGGGSGAGGVRGSAGGGGDVTNAGGASAGGTGLGGASAVGGDTGSGGFGAGGFGAGGVAEIGAGGSSTGGTTVGGTGGAGATSGTGGTTSTECPSGDYSGKLKGPYTTSAGTKDIGASILFAVDSSGAVTGSFMGPGNAKAKLTGRVDCTTGVLAIDVQNGTYPVGPLSVSFTGTIGGRYSGVSQTFVDGTWDLTERNNPGNGGTGTWAP